MNRKFKVITTIGVILIFSNPIQANALFGSECRDAKKSYKNVMAQFNEATRKYEIGRADYEARKLKVKQACLQNTQKAIKENPSVWNFAKPDKKSFCDFLPFNVTTPNMADNPKYTYERAMEIVVNYKKCFSVEQYLDAKQWLREN